MASQSPLKFPDHTVQVLGRSYTWTPEGGLDPAVVETVEGWIRRQAHTHAQTASRRGLDLEDLLQAGRLGALCAARRFDPCRTNTFLTYARWWIRQAVLEALGQADDVHLPERDKRRALRTQTLPTVLRIQQPVGEDQALQDLLAGAEDPHEESEDAQREGLLRKALDRLQPQDRLILTLRHGLAGDPQTLEAVGQQLEPPVGRERVRQLQKKAESRLRSALRELGWKAPSPPLSRPLAVVPAPPPAPQTPPVSPARPGTRRADREARRARRAAAQGTPLPLDPSA